MIREAVAAGLLAAFLLLPDAGAAFAQEGTDWVTRFPREPIHVFRLARGQEGGGRLCAVR